MIKEIKYEIFFSSAKLLCQETLCNIIKKFVVDVQKNDPLFQKLDGWLTWHIDFCKFEGDINY